MVQKKLDQFENKENRFSESSDIFTGHQMSLCLFDKSCPLKSIDLQCFLIQFKYHITIYH